VGLRVTREEEVSGLDLAQHREVGYAFVESENGSHPSDAPARSHAPIAVPLAQAGDA
jgi:hypothetical protein